VGKLKKATMLIALDSNIFIAALSKHEEHSLIAQQLVRDIAQGKYHAITSSIAYGEALSVRVRGGPELDLESFLSSIEHLSTIPADDDICLNAGQLRAEPGRSLKLPDALHAATAILANADLLIANDRSLMKIAQKFLLTTTLAEWQ
jgi:predicted nucleic acid-binding protein